jgi:hypothetical protein
MEPATQKRRHSVAHGEVEQTTHNDGDKKKRRRGRQGQPQSDPSDPPQSDHHKAGTDRWVPTERKSEAFEAYFRSFFADETEFNQALAVLKRDLPTTFRFTPISSFNTVLKQKFSVFQNEVKDIEIANETIKFGPIAWYSFLLLWFIH